jgi:pimeloyl-ACP methyl ester carboxylesterase
MGGLFVRLFASTYPSEVAGLILFDPYSERLETLLTPERWAALVRLNVRQGTDTVKPIPGYGDLETLGFGKDNVVMRTEALSSPLHPMPLAVLAHGRPFELIGEPEGFSSDALEVSCGPQMSKWRRSSPARASSSLKTVVTTFTKISRG